MMKNKKVDVIIQARMGSTRLPGKVMMKICGKTVLEHVIERVLYAKNVDSVIIATTIKDKDDPIVKLIENYPDNRVSVFRGSEDDVLSRYYHAAKYALSDVIVRITSDCPLIDPVIVDKVIAMYFKGNYDYVSNRFGKRTFPVGLDTEVFSFSVLEDMYNNAKDNYDREHVTPFCYKDENRLKYNVGKLDNEQDWSNNRWTLDEEEDFIFLKAVFEALYDDSKVFLSEDIIDFLAKNPEIKKINENVVQKTVVS